MKTYVAITAKKDELGNLVPNIIQWSDGREIPVDRVLDVRQAPAIVDGRQGMRYICRIGNKEVYLLQDSENGNWYIEI